MLLDEPILPVNVPLQILRKPNRKLPLQLTIRLSHRRMSHQVVPKRQMPNCPLTRTLKSVHLMRPHPRLRILPVVSAPRNSKLPLHLIPQRLKSRTATIQRLNVSHLQQNIDHRLRTKVRNRSAPNVMHPHPQSPKHRPNRRRLRINLETGMERDEDGVVLGSTRLHGSQRLHQLADATREAGSLVEPMTASDSPSAISVFRFKPIPPSRVRWNNVNFHEGYLPGDPERSIRKKTPPARPLLIDSTHPRRPTSPPPATRKSRLRFDNR